MALSTKNDILRLKLVLPTLLQFLPVLGLTLTAIHQHHYQCSRSTSLSIACYPLTHSAWSWSPSSSTIVILGVVSWISLVWLVFTRLQRATATSFGDGVIKDAYQQRQRRQTKRGTNTKRMALDCSIDDIVRQVKDVATLQTQSTLHATTATTITPIEKDAASDRLISCLDALSLRCPTSTPRPSNEEESDNSITTIHQSCRYASYTIFRNHNDNDEVVSASFSLLAKVASSTTSTTTPLRPNESTKLEMNRDGCDGLDVPIDSMRRALQRTKGMTHYCTSSGCCGEGGAGEEGVWDSDAEEREQLSAELQRKACIYLGAVAEMDRVESVDGGINSGIGNRKNDYGKSVRTATSIVDNGGMEAILETLMWFRFHVHVANWALWALFNICYDHGGNKKELIRLNGIDCICTVLNCIMKDLEEEQIEDQGDNEWKEVKMLAVQHGIAILFDTMRYDETMNANNAMQVRVVHRRVAINVGMLEVVRTATRTFPKSTEIVLMGQQMLVTMGVYHTNNSSKDTVTSRRRRRRNPVIQM